MTAPVVELLYLLIFGWSSVGIGLLIAYHRSASTVVFRLAAVFLAVWAFVATTALTWIVANGGWAGIVRLVASPLSLFDPRFYLVWIIGALGTFGIFFTAFLLSQAVGRGYLAARRPRPLDWPEGLATPTRPTDLLAFSSPVVEAFTFTLIEPGGPTLLRRRDVILLSDGLLDELSAEEQEAVVAHELGHLRELDGRYLTFFRTLARLIRWDPILAILADRLTVREEFRADLDAVETTHRPRALARALYKATARSPGRSRVVSGLLGAGGRRGRQQALERIRRLVSLAESGRFPEELGA